jgi:TetR/AcrR family transcriptional repressor of mexJK operon
MAGKNVGIPKGRAGRPRDEEKRGGILAAGWSEFLNRGVEAASLERIAQEAGVSRVTLYRQFPDKTALFEATMRGEMERLGKSQSVLQPGRSLRKGLVAFGLALMRYLTSPEVVSFYSVLAGDLRRHPNLARAFYDLGPGTTLRNLAAILEIAGQRGELNVRSPEEAAEQLIGLWQGLSNFRLAMDVNREELIEGLERRVERAVDVFLAAYSPRRKTRLK